MSNGEDGSEDGHEEGKDLWYRQVVGRKWISKVFIKAKGESALEK